MKSKIMNMNLAKPIEYFRDVANRVLQLLFLDGGEIAPVEVNWSNFVNTHAGDWRGTRTVYEQDGTLRESFPCEETLWFNWRDDYDVPISFYPFRPVLPISVPDLGTVFQQHLSYPNGRKVEHHIRVNRIEQSSAEGIYHPHRDSLRGLFLANGISAWMQPQLNIEPRGHFGAALTLRHGTGRVSVGLWFSGDGKIDCLTIVRESILGTTTWSHATELPDAVSPPSALPGKFAGKFSGQELTVTSPVEFSVDDVVLEPLVDCSSAEALSSSSSSSSSSCSPDSLFAFPEGVYVRFPSDMNAPEARVIEVLWSLESQSHESPAPLVYRARLCYDAEGRFCALSGGAFTQVNPIGTEQ